VTSHNPPVNVEDQLDSGWPNQCMHKTTLTSKTCHT